MAEQFRGHGFDEIRFALNRVPRLWHLVCGDEACCRVGLDTRGGVIEWRELDGSHEWSDFWCSTCAHYVRELNQVRPGDPIPLEVHRPPSPALDEVARRRQELLNDPNSSLS